MYSSHKERIINSLKEANVSFDPNNDADIQSKFLESTKAQDIAGSSAQQDFANGANRLLNKYSQYGLNPDKVFYLTRYLGSGGADTYINILINNGVDAADKHFENEWRQKGVKNVKPSEGMYKFISRI